MELHQNENVLKVFRRHKTPYIWHVLKVTFAMAPFVLIIFFLAEVISTGYTVILSLIVLLFYIFALVYSSLLYWLDNLTITDKRIVFTNWRSLVGREENEAHLTEIQDIKTREKGFLSKWDFFDYGEISIETSASNTTIFFDKAPDPEGIKKYLVSYLPRMNISNKL